MRKMTINTILLIFIFNFLATTPLSITGTSYSFTLTEIGSIIPTSSVINFQCIDNELMFILDINNRILVVNITDPFNIVELHSSTLYYPHDIELDINREIVFATSSSGVSIFSYSNPLELELYSTYKNYTSSTFIQVREKLLFIGAEEYGLQIVNVTDPYNPVMLDNWLDPMGDVGQVYLVENYAFVATRLPNTGAPPTYLDLKVLDISDPTNISYVSTVDVGENYNGGAPRAHKDDLIYFNDHAYGLKILNFSNPYCVSVIGNFSDDGFYNDLELLDNDIVILADDYFGVKIVDCTNPELPILINSNELTWRTLRVVVEDTNLYVATLSGGVRIFDMDITTKGVVFSSFWLICSLFVTNTVITIIFKRRKHN